MAAAVTVLSKVQINLKSEGDSQREVSHNTTSVNGVKYAIVRGVNAKGQRYLDQYDLEKKTHEKRPLQGGADALVTMSDEGLMAITSGGKMQVFNMATRQVVSSASLPVLANGEANSVKFWKFVSANIMVIAGVDAQVYTWQLGTPNAAPVLVFKVQDALLSGVIVDIQMSEDAQWFAAVVRSTSTAADAKQQVQMFAAGRNASSVQEASAAAVYGHAARGCTIMALASKGPQGFRLIVAELPTGPGAPKFERLVLELPSDSSQLLPVCILRQGNDPNILTVISQKGHVHVANTETRTWVAHAVLGQGNEDFFTGAFSPGFAHLVAISAQGQLYAISARGVGVIPNPQAAAAVAAASGLVASSSSSILTPTPSTPVAGTPSNATPPSASPAPAVSETSSQLLQQYPAQTSTPPPKDSFSELSLQSMVEPRKPTTPLEEFFAVYPAEALSLYKNDRAKFLPYIQQQGIMLNWQGLLAADKDMSVASKLAFGQALAHLELAARNSVVTHFESLGYLDDTFTKANYIISLLGTANTPADADLQTNAIVTGLAVNPSAVVASVVGKRWTHFDPIRVSEAAVEAKQWDMVWLLASSFEQRQQLLSMHSMQINANQILQWMNGLPADAALTILQTLHTARAASALSWERIAAPPNDRLAPHLDLTVSPPFQTLRVKIASANTPELWKRYIDTALLFGEDKEVSRILLQYSSDIVVTEIAEAAVKRAASESHLYAALPLLVLAERSNKIEDLVIYHIGRPNGAMFLIPYATVIQPQNAGRVVAIVAANGSVTLLRELILACARYDSLSTANLWLAANQSSTTQAISSVLSELATSVTDVPLITAYNAKFNPAVASQSDSEAVPSEQQ